MLKQNVNDEEQESNRMHRMSRMKKEI